MPSLRELQQRFAAAVLGADGTASTLADGRPRADRIGIYRRTIRTNYRNALGATYPVVRRVIGAPRFEAAVDAYVEACPSRSGDATCVVRHLAGTLCGKAGFRRKL